MHVSTLLPGTALEIQAIGTLCHGENWRGSKGTRVDVADVAATLRPKARTAYLTRAAATRDDLATMISTLRHRGVPRRTLSAMIRRNKSHQAELVRYAFSERSELSYFEFAQLLTDERAIELLAEHLRSEPWALSAVCGLFAKHGFLDAFGRWSSFILTKYAVTEVVHPGVMLGNLVAQNRAAGSKPTSLAVLDVLTTSVLGTGSDLVLRTFADVLLGSDLADADAVAATLERRVASATDRKIAGNASALLSYLIELRAQRSPFVKPPALSVSPRKQRRNGSRRLELEHLPLVDLAALIPTGDALVREVAAARGVLPASEALRDQSPRVRAAATAHLSDQTQLDALTSWTQPPSVLLAVIEKSRGVEPLERLLEEVSERPGPLAELVASRTRRRLAELYLTELAAVSAQRREPVVARAVIAQIGARDLLCELAMSLDPEVSRSAAGRLQEVTAGPHV